MLNISYEFRYGFFFARLSGHITKNNYNSFIEELNTIINKVGIKRIVLNIDNIKSIDICCMSKLTKYVKEITYKEILILLCDNKSLLSKRGFKDIISTISYEKEVYNFI
jgi:anti-anti-sigma regulatory factor